MTFKQWFLAGAGLVSFLQPATAQKIDLSVLAGAAGPTANVSGPFVSVSGGVSPAVQVNFAWRIAETGSGELYLELPVSRVTRVSAAFDFGQICVRTGSYFAVPGVRYRVFARSRVSPYLAAGFGMGWFDSADITWRHEPGVTVTSGVKPVAGFGGGLDFRVSRLVAVRAEIRDYVACGSGVAHHHQPAYSAGVGIRF